MTETVKIVSKSAPGGYVVINKSDFDPKIHELYGEESKPEKPRARQPEAKPEPPKAESKPAPKPEPPKPKVATRHEPPKPAPTRKPRKPIKR